MTGGDPAPISGPGPGPYRPDAHAVIVGINHYQDDRIRDLEFARADAKAVYEVLTDPELGRFNPANVTLLLDEQATKDSISSALATQLPRRSSKDDTVFLYFAGHGAPAIDPRTRSADGMEKYLVPYSAKIDDLRTTGLSMDDFPRFFDWIDTSQILFFIDACYSGTAGGRSFEIPGITGRAALSGEFLERLGGEGRYVVTACGVNEISLETPKLGHGVFTHHLVEGLQGAADADGDGLVTLDELYQYLHQRVERQARRLGGSMNPIKSGYARGSVYLVQYETEAQKRARQLATEAAAAFEGDDFEQAEGLWQEILGLDPGHQEASLGLADIAARREEERRRREEEERQRREEIERRQRVLLDEYRSGALPLEEYTRGMELLEKGPGELEHPEWEMRNFLDHLTDGRMTVAHYLASIRLLTRPAPEVSQATPETPAEEPAPAIEETAEISPPEESAETAVAAEAEETVAGAALPKTGDVVEPEPLGVAPQAGDGPHSEDLSWASWIKEASSWGRARWVYGVLGAVLLLIVLYAVWVATRPQNPVEWAETEVAALPSAKRAAAVLSVAERLLPVDAADLKTIGILAWALDYFPGRSADAGERRQARRLRDELLAPLREARPPPAASGDGWVAIPAGSFRMGSEEGEARELPVHQVRLSAFRMLDHEVTNREYRLLIPKHSGGEDLPAVEIDWYHAYAYAAWLGGRLPTEAEWEYAARAGCKFEYCDREGNETNLDEVGWYDDNSAGELHPVKQKEPNPWGLYDMHGNGWEWVADWYDWGWYGKSEASRPDPWGPPSGGGRVIRGGSYRGVAGGARSAFRGWGNPDWENSYLGFRVVVPVAPSDR